MYRLKNASQTPEAARDAIIRRVVYGGDLLSKMTADAVEKAFLSRELRIVLSRYCRDLPELTSHLRMLFESVSVDPQNVAVNFG